MKLELDVFNKNTNKALIYIHQIMENAYYAINNACINFINHFIVHYTYFIASPSKNAYPQH